jgi:lipoprotein Spr
MKKYLFYFLLYNIGLVISAKAQKSDGGDDNKNKRALKFIEDIEINKNNPTIKSSSSKKTTKSIKIIPLKEEVSNKSVEIEKSTLIQFKYAMILNVEVESMKNEKLYRFIDEWLNTRYSYGGSDKSGIDCSSFTGKLEKEIYNHVLPRNSRQQYKACEKISIADATEGDLVFFNTRGGVSHVGVYLANGYFVHASTSSGVIINNLEENYYKQRFLSAGSVTENIEEN